MTMTEKKRLPVDVGFLSMLLQNSDPAYAWYLDSATGDLVNEDGVDIPEDPEEAGLIFIEAWPSWEGYNDMEDFIVTVESEELAGKLSRAIKGRGAFRYFKDVLHDYPDEQARWFEFRDSRERERTLEWLAGVGIEPIETKP